MSQQPVEARSNFLPNALTDEPQTALLVEPCTPYREKDDFRQHNLPYLPFHVKGPSGELLNVEFLSASVVRPESESRSEEQQRQEEKAEENGPMEKVMENGYEDGDEERREEDEPREETSEERIEAEENEQQEEEPPPKDPFDYHTFFPDENCICSYLEKNVETYQPFDHHEQNNNEPEPERSPPPLPRFLTIPQNDQRQSGNTDTDPPPAETEAEPEREATPPREVEPVAEKRELSKSKSMSCFPWDVGTGEAPTRSSIWKSQPNLNVDPNRKYSMPRLKPILPKQRSFSKSVPSEIPRVTLYTEFLISSEYKDPVDLPNDKIGFVETHIHRAGKLRRSKSDADIRDKFGPLPYVPSPEVEKPAPRMMIPRRHFDHDYYDLAKCKRQMGNKPKPTDAEKRKGSVHSLPALKPIVPGKDKKSIMIRKRKSKELSPGYGGMEKVAKRESKKVRERKRESTVIPRNSPTKNGNNLEEILQRLRNFSKDYQHFFGAEAKPKSVTCQHAKVQAGEEEEAECGNSEPFETVSRSGSTKSRDTQTPKRGTSAVENSEFRQFRNFVKDQKETSQKGLLSIQDILSEGRNGESVLNSATIENKAPCEKRESSQRIGRNDHSMLVKVTDEQVDGSNPEEMPVRNSSQPSHPELEEVTGTTSEATPKEQPTDSEKPLECLQLEKETFVPRTDQSPTDSSDSTKRDEIVNANSEATTAESTPIVTTEQQEVTERLAIYDDVRENLDSVSQRAETAVGSSSAAASLMTWKIPNGPLAFLEKESEEDDHLKSTGAPRQAVTTEKTVEGCDEMEKKREDILCVPDFDTPRTSRVSPPDVPLPKGGSGRAKGLDHPSDNSPDGAVRFVGKGKSACSSSSPSPLPATPPCGKAMSESFKDLKNKSGIAGAIAQLSLEGGAGQRPETSTAQEEYLRRQNWETGNMDYMGKDSFDNIWSKICQTIEAKELEEKAAGSPQPSTETPKPTEKPTEPTETPETLQKCPEYIETLPGEPAAGPVEDDEIIFSKPENRQSCLTNIAEEEEAGTEGLAGRSVKLSDILQGGGGSAGQKLQKADGEKKPETETKTEEKIEGKGAPVGVQDKPTSGPEKAECKVAPSADGQNRAEGKPEVSLGSMETAGPPKSQPPGAQPTGAQVAAVQPPAAQSPAAQPPAVQSPAAQPPAVQSPAAQPPAAQSPAVQPPAAQSPAAQPPAVQPTAAQPPAAQSPAAQPPAVQPTAAQPPAVQSPAAQSPAAQPPAAQSPAAQPPAAQSPAAQPPAAQPPAAQSPAATPTGAQPPAAQPPAAQSPAAQPPAAQSPAAQPPAAQSPAAQPPAAQPPAAQPPAAQSPAATPTGAQPPAAQSPAAQTTGEQPPAAKPECKTVAGAQSTDGQKRPEVKLEPVPQKKGEECTTVAIPSPPIFFPGPPLPGKPQSKDKTEEAKPEVKSEPIPLPPPESRPTVTPPQEPTSQTTRSESPKEEGKQKKGVFSKILEMVGVAPKEKNGSETSNSVFYDVDETDQPRPEVEKKTEEVDKEGGALEGATEAKESGNAVQPDDKKLPKPEEAKIETNIKTSKPEEEKSTPVEIPIEEERPGQAPIAKPARNSSPKEAKHPAGSIQVLPARKSPSPKLKIPPKLPETEVTTPTPPPQPEAPPRRNSALLKVDDTILETPPVVESPREATEETVKGKVATEIEGIIGKAKSEVESLLQDRRSAEKEAGEESSELINTMKLLMGGDQPGKSTPEEVEELRVTSEEERKRHKGEVVTSKLSDQILKAIPPPRRKAISEASASTSAIPKAAAEQKSPQPTGESKGKPAKPSAIPVPPPRNRGKPTTPAPPKPKGKK